MTVKGFAMIALLAATLAGGCKKKDNAGGGSGTATASGSGLATASGSGEATGAAAAPGTLVDVKMFATAFDSVWKSPGGDERAKALCATMPAFQDLSAAINKDAPPEGRDAKIWHEGVDALQGLVAHMSASCGKEDLAAVEKDVIVARGLIDMLTGAPAPGDASGGSGGGAGAAPIQSATAAFAAAFDPVNSKLDHVSRARTACEQRPLWLERIKAMDQKMAGVDALLKTVDEMSEPCDAGNIKDIEAKLDEAKKILDTLPR